MGSLFCAQLAALAHQVTAIDLQQKSNISSGNIRYIRSDVCALNKEAMNTLATADLVIAALPETAMMTAWQEIMANQKESSLFVDTLSVKTPFINTISQSKRPSEIISINPMFAPSLGFSGQSAAVIEIRRGPIADTFLALLESWGCRPVFLTAEEHDRYTAILQTLTHAAILAFGMALQKFNYDLEKLESIMPPPHRTLLALVARILSADPVVYWDIQVSNPYAADARRALESSAQELTKLIENQDQRGFEKSLASLARLFDAKQLEKFQQVCSKIFGHFSPAKK